MGLFGGDDFDLMYQAASAALSYRALPGQSFDLSGFEFLDLVGSGQSGQSNAVQGIFVTIADASGAMTYTAPSGENSAFGSFRVPLWQPGSTRIAGAVDLSAVTSVSIRLSGQHYYDNPRNRGAYVNYSLTSVQLVVPGPGGVVVMALLTGCRRRLGFSRRTC